MANYTNFFSSNLVQASQNSGQNIDLTKERSTFSWSAGNADFCMSNIINIQSTHSETPVIVLPRVTESDLFQDVIVFNQSNKVVHIESAGVAVASLDIFNDANPGKSALYFYVTLNSASGWEFLSFDIGDEINVDVTTLAGSGLETSGGSKINEALNNILVNQNSYNIQRDDLAKLLVFNAGDVVGGNIYYNLPSSADTPILPDGFFLYVSNVNADGLFYISPGENDRINNNPAGQRFILSKNTSAMVVVSIDKNNVYNWFAILNSPSTIQNQSNAFFPAKAISANYILSLADMATTLIADTWPPNTPKPINITITLPHPTINKIPNGFLVNIINNGYGTLTLAPESSFINNMSSPPKPLITGPKISYQLVSDGTNWFAIGLGDSNGLVTDTPAGGYLDSSNFGEAFIASSSSGQYNFILQQECMHPGIKFYFSALASNTKITLSAPNSKINNNGPNATAQISYGSGSIGITPACLTMDHSGNYWVI